MRCSNCGMDNIVNDAVHCPNCGASLITPGNWNNQPSAPQQSQQQPQQAPPQYQAPPQQYYAPPQPQRAQRVATVKNIGLTEILFLFSGLFLIIVGLDNLDVVKSSGYGGQVFALGLIAFLIGLFVLALTIMSSMFKALDKYSDILMLVLSLAFVIYGFVMVFATYGRQSGYLGSDGAILFAAGLAGLTASGLKMDILK